MRSHGYSLLEMVIVLILISILALGAATALRSFQQSGTGAEADAAMLAVFDSQLRFRQQYGTFATDPAELPLADGQATVTTGPSEGPREISVVVGDTGTLALAAQVTSSTCRWRTVESAVSGGSIDQGEEDTSICAAESHLPESEAPEPASARQW